MLGVASFDSGNKLHATDAPVLENVEDQVAFHGMLENDVEVKLPFSVWQILAMRTNEVNVRRALLPDPTDSDRERSEATALPAPAPSPTRSARRDRRAPIHSC